MFFQPVYLKCDIMNNAGIVDRVDCACKLNSVPPETRKPLHALLGVRLSVDSDECCIPTVDTNIPVKTLLGEVITPLIPSTSTTLNDYVETVTVKQNSTVSHTKVFTFLRKKVSDKHGATKSIFPISNCICKTHKWKFPMIMQKAWKHNRRVRLKSNPSFQRYQSHHSSSDEDWFEEIADDETNNFDEKKNKCNSDENKTLANNAEDCPVNLDNESNHVATNRFKSCSSYAFKKIFVKRPLTENRKDPNNSCRIT